MVRVVWRVRILSRQEARLPASRQEARRPRVLPVPASSQNSFISREGSAEYLWEPRGVASNPSDLGILDKVSQQLHWCSGVSREDCSIVHL